MPALLLPIQATFDVGDLRMGQVVTLYGLLFGLGALPAGWLVDRVGARPLLVICLWGAAASVTGMAFSPSLGAFAACAAVMGLCLSVYHPAGTSLLTHTLPLSGRVFATHGMIGNLGIAGSGVIAASLGAFFGWRVALGALALVGFVLGLVALRLPAPDLHAQRAQNGEGRLWPFVLLLLAIAFMGTVYRGMTTFLPKYFTTALGGEGSTGVALGGLLTTVAMIAGMAGMWVSGRWLDRDGASPKVFLTAAVGQLPFLVLLGVLGGPAVLPLAMGMAFFHFFTQPPGNHMVARFTPSRMRGLGYGIYFFVSFGAGSFGATLAGWTSERWGAAATFPVLAAVLVPSILVAVVLVVAMRGEGAASGH